MTPLSVSTDLPSTMPKEKPLRAVASENYLLNTNALVQLQVSKHQCYDMIYVI